MKHITRHFKIILALSVICIIILLTGCSTNNLTDLFNKGPTAEELLQKVPKMDASAFNRFLFNIDMVAGNTDGDGKEFNMSGALETYKTISHLYNLDISFAKSEYETKAESWTNFGTGEIYKNLGDGWITSVMQNEHAINDLVDVINNRNTEMLLTVTDSACTLSWTFPTDNDYLFGTIVGHYTTDKNLNGYGRITAVFNPETYEFQYFTVVISVNNEERAGGLLDAMFYWEIMNSPTDALIIPEDISRTAYKAATGVSSDGYDEVVNPMAEDFIKVYGGTAEVNHDNKGSYMFWTLENEGTSATVNYTKTKNPDTFYEESRSFLMSFYGESAEETDNGAYFYDSSIGELIYMAKGDDWYAEIIITGKAESTQGELRKSLITYKSRLNI